MGPASSSAPRLVTAFGSGSFAMAVLIAPVTVETNLKRNVGSVIPAPPNFLVGTVDVWTLRCVSVPFFIKHFFRLICRYISKPRVSTNVEGKRQTIIYD